MSQHNPLSVQYICQKTEYNVHYHDRNEIICITEGACEITITGKTYTAGKNDIILIGNLEHHSTRILEEPYCRYVITFHPAWFQSEIADNRLVAMFKHHAPAFSHCLAIGQTDVPALVRKLYSETVFPDSFSDSLSLCCLKSILISTFRAHPDCFSADLNRQTEIILKAEGYIDEHFKENLRIDTLADHFYLSKCYFSHSFKAVSGFSPKQYLTVVRLNHAAHLLSSTDLSVTDICMESGFSDMNNFIRLFRTRFHMTPGEWRNRNSSVHL